jgi:beta-N-acetylhexosaminidase
MSLGPVMIDLAGPALTAEERELLRHPRVGGVILFSRNYESPEQLLALTADIHGLREPHLLVGVDQEGGRVQRFREGFTRLPSPAVFGRIYDHDPKHADRLAATCGWLMAAELRAVGVDFSFAPVLDLDRGLNQVIGDRAFHRQPDVVADLGRAYLAGMHRAGMAGVGKHFPGHGGVSADSHVAVPVDERRFADIYMEDILPFERLIDEGLAGIMPAHVIYPRLVPEPSGFSSFWLRRVLRDRLGFQGAIFSDDLAMEGASVAGDLPDRARAALAAGCDMVLLCHRREAVAGILDALARWNDPAAQVRLARMHGRLATPRDTLLGSPEWHGAVQDLVGAEDQTSLDLDFGNG